MSVVFEGDGPIFEAANAAYSVLFEGKGLVCRIIDGTRDSLVSRGIPKDMANDIVLKTRQLFFDPFAAPGAKPATDPTFKKMLPMFGHLASMMVDTFHYGTPRYDREAAEDFAARFVEHAKANFRAGPPELPASEFDALANKISNGKTSFSPSRQDYECIPVRNWDELKELSGKYRLGAWCNVNSEDDWNRYSLYGHGKFYLLVSRDAETTHGSRDVIGITVNHYGKVVYAFDRENACVDKAAITALADEMGLTEPFATDFSTGIDLVRAGYDAGQVFGYYKPLHNSVALVGFDDTAESCLLDESGKRYISDTFTEIDPVKGSDSLYILDSTKLFDVERETVLLDTAKLSSSLILDPFSGTIDDDEVLMPLRSLDVRRDGWFVNAVCFTDREGTLLLDKENTTPFRHARFNTSTIDTRRNIAGDEYSRPKWATVEEMDGNDFWTVEADGGEYIVNVPGKKLEEYKFIPHIKGGSVSVLSPNGYYSVLVRGYSEADRYYLMKDGKKVFECPFCDIGRDSKDSYVIYMVTMDKKKGYLFDPETGKLSETKD